MDLKERAKEMVDGLEAEIGLASATAVYGFAKERLMELSFERLRKIEAESGQLLMFVGQGPKQRTNDRNAEEQLVLDVFGASDQDKRFTAAELSVETKLGARIAAVLARMVKQGLLKSRGRGGKATWGMAEAETESPAPSPAAPAPARSGPVDLDAAVRGLEDLRRRAEASEAKAPAAPEPAAAPRRAAAPRPAQAAPAPPPMPVQPTPSDPLATW